MSEIDNKGDENEQQIKLSHYHREDAIELIKHLIDSGFTVISGCDGKGYWTINAVKTNAMIKGAIKPKRSSGMRNHEPTGVAVQTVAQGAMVDYLIIDGGHVTANTYGCVTGWRVLAGEILTYDAENNHVVPYSFFVGPEIDKDTAHRLGITWVTSAFIGDKPAAEVLGTTNER